MGQVLQHVTARIGDVFLGPVGVGICYGCVVYRVQGDTERGHVRRGTVGYGVGNYRYWAVKILDWIKSE